MAPRYDYSHVKGYSDDNLRELLPSWHESLNIDAALVEMRNCLLQAEVHQYWCQMMHLKQLNDQMEAHSSRNVHHPPQEASVRRTIVASSGTPPC